MKLALFGATGFTGKSVLKMALEDGHDVYALVRDPARVTIEHERLTLMKGNALNEVDVDRLISQTEVVLHCLGVGGKGDGKHTTLVSDSVRLVVKSMQTHGCKRLICMSNLGAGGSGPWLLNHIVTPLFLRWLLPLIEDKERMEALLKESTLEWCAIRLPNIVEGPEKTYKESEDGKGTSLSITTESVARYMLEQATKQERPLSLPHVSN